MAQAFAPLRGPSAPPELEAAGILSDSEAVDDSLAVEVLALDGLIEPLERNLERLADTQARLRAVQNTLLERRVRMKQLHRELRPALALLSELRDSARRAKSTLRPRPGPLSVRRPKDTAKEAVDAARLRQHEAYAATRDTAIRDELMTSYDGFARSLALKFRHRDSTDDLVQVARIGLLHAIDRFDPSRGRPFPLFASITITGELKRHLRDKTWGMRVPRSLQEDYLAVMRAVDELTAEGADESPSMDKVAAHSGMPVERVVEAMELRFNRRALSLDVPAGATAEELPMEVGRDEIGFGELENRDLLARLLARLPERDRRIIELRFVQEMTQAQIAAEVGVSQMCVSRVLARTLGRLRVWARTEIA